jgi:heptosyltransferase II
MKSLIIAPQWIGDAVMTEPLLRALSARGERLTVMAVPWVAPVYRAMGHIEGLEATVDVPFQHGGLQWHARRDLAARIQSGEWGRFDRAYVLPNSLKSAFLPWLAGIPKRIGYAGEMRYGLLNKRLANPPRHARGSMVAHYLALANRDASQLGAGDESPLAACTRPQLFATPTDTPSALNVHTLAAKTYTVIAPGAEFGEAKRWPIEHFAALIASLAESNQPVVLLGSNKDAAICQVIRNKALRKAPAASVTDLSGKTNLTEAINIIAQAKGMVSNDSGLMHVAAAFGIPQVAVFGSSDPRHTPPLSDNAKVLWLGLACSPCFRRECPLEGSAKMRCLKKISPDSAHQALTLKLGLLNFVTEATRGKRDVAFPIGSIGQQEVNRIRAVLNREVKSFPRTLEASAVRHILKKHGNTQTEAARGQICVTTGDLMKIADLAPAGQIELGNKLHRGSPTVVTTLEDSGYQYTLVQAIRAHDMTVITLHKRQAKKYLTGNT